MNTVPQGTMRRGVAPDEQPAPGPVLVATDGSPAAEAALRAAVHMGEVGTGVVVLTVMARLPLVAADYGMMIPPTESDQTRRKELEERVTRQVASLGSVSRNWVVQVRDGDPPAVIAHVARELRARLVILGLGQHQLLDRLFGSETALHTLRLTRVPMLAVPPDFDRPPRRIVVAMDFSYASVRAAKVALRLVGTASIVYLVHVAPRMEVQAEAFAAWMSLYGEGMGPAFERVKADLELPPSVVVETVSRNGKPSREVLDFARSVQADMIVTGSSGAGLVDRILVGSTATGLIHGAHCAILAVPTAGFVHHAGPWPEGASVAIPEERWAEELASFSKRNAGRRAALEVDDPEIGAQAQERDYPFSGVAFDHHDRRVEIMLGGSTGVHLTRGISGVTAIDLVRDERGEDWILRVAHRGGQTLLSLNR